MLRAAPTTDWELIIGTPQRIALLAVAAVALIVGFVLAGSGGSSKHAPAVRRVQLVITAGKPVGGARALTANKGDTVDLKVSSDVADEIHLHGYDLHTNVAAGGVAQLRFRATITGNFVIEFESRSLQIAALTVKP